ncbi:hypothetical protein EV13_2269 [Prochlorococcus sp. MIT 0702]|nr:hypothetical protein EV13_2269 [Prochlorococcus sp. MIT 0702]
MISSTSKASVVLSEELLIWASSCSLRCLSASTSFSSLSRCCRNTAALSSPTAGRITKGADANARAAAPVSDKERRTERCTGVERLKGH